MTWEYLIGSEKDFEGAPDWCTHVSRSNEYGLLSWEMDSRAIAGNKYQWVGKDRSTMEYADGINNVKLDIAFQRRKRKSTEWNGEGLPPVGCVCEALITYRDDPLRQWRKVKVVCSGDEFGAADELIVVDLENSHPCWTDEFRPLRTKEQIERDDAVKEITGLIEATPWRKWEKIAECIFDAGYRKTK